MSPGKPTIPETAPELAEAWRTIRFAARSSMYTGTRALIR